MAYLPIRALNRSSAVRIDGQKILPGTTFYINLATAGVPKQLAYHSAIGQVYVVGGLTGSNVDQVVTTGGTVVAGAGLNVNVTAGEMKIRSTGVYVTGAAATNKTITANSSGNPRIDLVVWDATSGAVSIVAGTAAASPVAPATPAGKVPLATAAVADSASAPGTITDVRPRS